MKLSKLPFILRRSPRSLGMPSYFFSRDKAFSLAWEKRKVYSAGVVMREKIHGFPQSHIAYKGVSRCNGNHS